MVDKKRRGESVEPPAPEKRALGKTQKLERHDSVPATVRLPPPSERWENDLAELKATTKIASRSTMPPPTTTTPPLSAVEGVELVILDEHQVSGGERRPWRAAEVWTKRRMYGLDSSFRCIEILDRKTGEPETTHEMLGARLGGGRLRMRDTVRYSYPLPLPGMEAMFSKGKKHGYTSAVEKMVVRVRVLHAAADEAPLWEQLGSRWSEPPPQ